MTVLTEVDCVVVSYNSAVDLPTCIDSLTSQKGIFARVVVVDNLSSDDSVETARYRGSAVIVNDSNRGFAAAVNQGLQSGCAPWVLMLNPDAQMASGRCTLFSRGLRQTRLWAAWGRAHSTTTAPSIRVVDPFPAS